jgi:thiopeptide-type bacteriocin biosynthesis protein
MERYGGIRGMELAERLFEADSDAVLSIVERLDGDEGADARWRLALRGCHLLLVDLGLDLAARTTILRHARRTFGAELRVDRAFEGQLGRRFRADRASLETLLASGAESTRLDPGFAALAARSNLLRPIADELLRCEEHGTLGVAVSTLAASYLHMHCNRLLSAGHRIQELVLYDFLCRLYESEAARKRSRGSSAGRRDDSAE